MSAATDKAIRNGLRSGPGIVKRRACDECRSRKLACTKEPNGCTRCKREAVACHYSVQKQMGRPKKRRNVERAREASPPAPVAPGTYDLVTAQEDPVVPMSDVAIDPASLIDPDLNSANMSFLDFFGPNFISDEPFRTQALGPMGIPIEGEISKYHIDFDAHYPLPPADSAGSTATKFSSPPRLSTPSLSSQGASPPELQQPPEHAHNPAPIPPGSCSCLATLYLALDSLTRLPTEIDAAIRVARYATKAAHDTVHCQTCSPPLNETTKVPISSFQNFTILGALLPSIADAYQRILDMVEDEAARAVREGRELHFVLPGYGGVWGQLEASEQICSATIRYRDVAMKPAMWRLMVRVLLKSDVYGIEFDAEDAMGACLRSSHLGLKDIVTHVEEKSNARHADVAALLEAGVLPPTGPGCAPAHPHSHAGEEPYCKRIIKIAKAAVDSLVIA